MPSLGELFCLPETVVRVIFIALGLCKLHSNVHLHSIIQNRVDEFKCKHFFDNQHLEISRSRICNPRMHFIKLGQYDQRPEYM